MLLVVVCDTTWCVNIPTFCFVNQLAAVVPLPPYLTEEETFCHVNTGRNETYGCALIQKILVVFVVRGNFFFLM